MKTNMSNCINFWTWTCIAICVQSVVVLSASHNLRRRDTYPNEALLEDNLRIQDANLPLPLDTVDFDPFGADTDLAALSSSSGILLQPSSMSQRSSFHLVDECVKITLDEGVFHFKSRGGTDQVCGLYFVSNPDKTIVIHVDYLDVKCADKGLISVVDGWELNGEVFPSPADHDKDLSSRFHDMCLENPKRGQNLQRTFTSSQNAALVQYRVPGYGQGFSLRVRHVHNPRPCNILVQDVEAVYSLENFGRRANCSLTTLFDAKIRVLEMSTGILPSRRTQSQSHVKFPSHRIIAPSTTYHKCGKLGLEDYVQIGGSMGLDSSKMELIDEFCGHQTHPMGGYTTVFCGMTTIRLVSSGKYQNRIVAEVRRADIEDLDNANYICGM